MSFVLAMVSLGSLSFFAGVTERGQHVMWGPEQWTALLITLISSLTAVVVTVIGNRRLTGVHRSLKLPSNGIDAGELLEAMGHVQHIQANLLAAYLSPEGKDHPDVPSAWDIARALRKQKDEDK